MRAAPALKISKLKINKSFEIKSRIKLDFNMSWE